METKKMRLTICFSGIAKRIVNSRGAIFKTDKELLKEVLRLFKEAREAYLEGD
jgi:hypothetical protein